MMTVSAAIEALQNTRRGSATNEQIERIEKLLELMRYENIPFLNTRLSGNSQMRALLECTRRDWLLKTIGINIRADLEYKQAIRAYKDRHAEIASLDLSELSAREAEKLIATLGDRKLRFKPGLRIRINRLGGQMINSVIFAAHPELQVGIFLLALLAVLSLWLFWDSITWVCTELVRRSLELLDDWFVRSIKIGHLERAPRARVKKIMRIIYFFVLLLLSLAIPTFLLWTVFGRGVVIP